MCHAIAGVLTCAKIESIQLDPDEGGATRMRGGIPIITLPAGYLGSSAIGAALITCVSLPRSRDAGGVGARGRCSHAAALSELSGTCETRSTVSPTSNRSQLLSVRGSKRLRQEVEIGSLVLAAARRLSYPLTRARSLRSRMLVANAQGFDTRASRVACLVLAVFFMLTLVWARKSLIAWITIIFTAGLIVLCWLVGSSVALRFLVLFIGVMSCLYSVVSTLQCAGLPFPLPLSSPRLKVL